MRKARPAAGSVVQTPILTLQASREREAQVLAARAGLRAGPLRVAAVTGVPARTVSRILVRHQIPRLEWCDPLTGELIRASRATVDPSAPALPGGPTLPGTPAEPGTPTEPGEPAVPVAGDPTETAAAKPRGPLSETGSEASPWLLLAGALVLGGAAMMFVRRRRLRDIE